MSWFSRILSPYDEKVKAAEDRWRAINKETKARGCRCGKSATKVNYHPVMGSVPFEIWTCDEHEGAEAWSDKTALYPHPEPCLGHKPQMRGGRINEPYTTWYCEYKKHQYRI